MTTQLRVKKKDGGFVFVQAERWQDRNWYQPVANQPVGEGITLIPTGESTIGAKKHTACGYIDGNEPGAEVLVVGGESDVYEQAGETDDPATFLAENLPG